MATTKAPFASADLAEFMDMVMSCISFKSREGDVNGVR